LLFLVIFNTLKIYIASGQFQQPQQHPIKIERAVQKSALLDVSKWTVPATSRTFIKLENIIRKCELYYIFGILVIFLLNTPASGQSQPPH